MNRTFAVTVFEWFGVFLGLAVTSAVLLRLKTQTKTVRVMVLLGCVFLPFFPVQGLTFAQFTLTVVGHFSIGTMVLLSAAMFERLTDIKIFRGQELKVLLVMLIVGGLMVFPETFGFGGFNGYQLGFGSVYLTIPLFILAVILIGLRMYIAASFIVFGVLGFDLGVLRSNNLWDYLLDPLLSIFSASFILWSLGVKLLSRRTAIEI